MLSSNPASNENFLLGLVALQGRLITRAELVAAVRQWAQDRSTLLGKILVDKGVLRPSDLSAVEILAGRLLDKHGNDVEKSLASLENVRSIRVAIEGVADADLRSCLERVCASLPAAEVASPTQAPDAAPRAAPPAAPSRFRIVRPLTEGQLGKLLLAHDEELNREVAIKEIHARHAGDTDTEARFAREVKYASELEHSGIVPIYGAGRYADGRRYYAMRYIKGENLRMAITRYHEQDGAGRDATARIGELRELLGRFVSVCQAIAFAHDKGVIHRDIKPENIMLSEDGETIVVDWGLARPTGPPGRDLPAEKTLVHAGSQAPALTTFGQVVGTPQYMYSLGATLYCVLTGQAPFVRAPAQTEPLLSLVQRGNFPPPRQVRPDVPPALEAICLKAMALRPEARYESARTMAHDIERWREGSAVDALPEPLVSRTMRAIRRQPLLAVAALALPAALIAFIVVHAILSPAPATHDELQAKLKAALDNLHSAQDEARAARADLEPAQTQLAAVNAKVGALQADRDAARKQAGAAEKTALEQARLAAQERKNTDLQLADAQQQLVVANQAARNAALLVADARRQRDDARAASEGGYKESIGELEKFLKKLSAGDKDTRFTVLLNLGLLNRNLADVRFWGGAEPLALEAYREAKARHEEIERTAPPKSVADQDLLLEQLAKTRNNLAWMLATSVDRKLRNPKDAAALSEKACAATQWKNGDYVCTRGVALYRFGEGGIL